MTEESSQSCLLFERPKERDRIGVWGFGNVSRDVVLSLVDEGLGKEIIFYGRPKKGYPNRAEAWIEDLKANTLRAPRLGGTNKTEDMAGLDVIFIGVGVPRKESQSRRDLLAINTQVLAKTSLEIKALYDCTAQEDLPILVYMGNPVTAMTWAGYKASGFPREKIMGQAGNLDSRRICLALSKILELSGNDMTGIVFGEHGDSMVASPRYFTVGVQYFLTHMLDHDAFRASAPSGDPGADENRHVLTLRLTQLLLANQDLRLSLFVFYSPSDGDAYFRPRVHYQIDDQWSTELGGNVFVGEREHTRFGQFEDDSNVFAGVRWSF